MKKILFFLPVLSGLLLAGCFMPPPKPQAVPFRPDYGPPPPKNYKEMIHAELSPSFFGNVIFGSTDGEYDFYPPVKGYTDASVITSTKQTFGWVVCGNMYRKERYSGYAVYDGPIPFYTLFKDGKIAEKLVGHTTFDHSTPHRLHDMIKKVCLRKVKAK
jgi:hypothetical protein